MKSVQYLTENDLYDAKNIIIIEKFSLLTKNMYLHKQVSKETLIVVINADKQCSFKNSIDKIIASNWIFKLIDYWA